MDKHEWFKLLMGLLNLIVLILVPVVLSCAIVTLITWLLKLFFQLAGLY